MSRQRGVVIVAAIFVLVVLSALAAFAVGISTNQQVGSALDYQAAQAYQAARAGVEWGMHRSMVAAPGTCPGGASNSTHSFTFPSAANSLAGMTVTVRCLKISDAAGGPAVYQFTSTACNQPLNGWTNAATACPNTTNPGSLYVERQITVSF